MRSIPVSLETYEKYGITSWMLEPNADPWVINLVMADGCEHEIKIHGNKLTDAEKASKASRSVESYCYEHTKQHGGYLGEDINEEDNHGQA